MVQSLWIALCVGFGVVDFFFLCMLGASLVILSEYYIQNKPYKEQPEEAKIAWSWAKFLAILFVLASMLSVYCGVFATKV